MNRGHSIKVPRLYKVSAALLRDYDSGKGSVKTLVYSDSTKKKHPNVKAIFALVSEAVQHGTDLESVLEQTDMLAKEKPLDSCLARILITELLWGKNVLPGQSRPVETVLKYESRLKKASLKGNKTQTKKKLDILPRYVRVNTLKTSMDMVKVHLKKLGMKRLKLHNGKDYDDFVQTVRSLESHQFIKDFHLKNVLVFAPKSDFHEDPMYLDGSLVLQDKASCLTVSALDPPMSSRIMDSCAAPGMKTCQAVAAITSDLEEEEEDCPKVLVTAVERDPSRCRILRQLLDKHCASEYVDVIEGDFLQLAAERFSDIEYMIVDPTCSGSGVPGNMVTMTPDRLAKLARLQVKMVKHALTFPRLKRLAYSTCSVNPEENELVIKEALEGNDDFEVAECLPDWSHRGQEQFHCEANKFVRASPKTDLCTGFFVAVLERKN